MASIASNTERNPLIFNALLPTGRVPWQMEHRFPHDLRLDQQHDKSYWMIQKMVCFWFRPFACANLLVVNSCHFWHRPNLECGAELNKRQIPEENSNID
jgi:hypothetical protein